MEVTYNLAESAVKQPEIEVGPTTVYIRRNYQQIEKDSQLMWTYEEAAISKDDAILLLTQQQKAASDILADSDALNIDHEYRITLLELNLSE